MSSSRIALALVSMPFLGRRRSRRYRTRPIAAACVHHHEHTSQDIYPHRDVPLLFLVIVSNRDGALVFGAIENLTMRSSYDAEIDVFDGDLDRRNTTQTDRRHRHSDADGIHHRDRRPGEGRPP